MFRLPHMAYGRMQQVRQWIQTNISDTYGNLAWTFNMDPYYNRGKIRPTRMLCTDSVTSPGDAAMTDVPVGFKFYRETSNQIFTVAGSFVHANGGVPNSNFSKYTTMASYPTNCNSLYSDLDIFNGYLYVTTASNVVYKLLDGVGWSNFTVTTESSSGHARLLCTFGNRMYMTTLWTGAGGGSGITSWNTSDSIAATVTSSGALVLDSTGSTKVTWMRPASNKIWIGTSTGYLTKGKGYIYEWDGLANVVTRSYRLEASGALACVIKDDIPYVLDSNGRLLKYNSGSFQEIARLPIFDASLNYPFPGSSLTFIHPNGMSIINGKINMLIRNTIYDSTGSIKEQCPSGVWEYDENMGLYHKYSLSYTATNTNTITDYGQNRLAAVGGLSDMKIADNSSNTNGSFLAGATIYKDGSNTVSQVWTNDLLPFSTTATYHSTLRAGYLVTTKLESTGLTEAWKGIVIKYKNYIDAAEKIVIKYRMSEFPPTEVPITWVNTTSFTTTSDISAYAIGDEVEITQGTGGGMCSHITNIVNNSGTYTVTVDEVHTGVTTGTAKARFQYWKKLGTATNAVKQFEQLNMPTSATSTWLQIKVFMLMDEGDEFEELAVINSVSQDYNG